MSARARPHGHERYPIIFHLDPSAFLHGHGRYVRFGIAVQGTSSEYSSRVDRTEVSWMDCLGQVLKLIHVTLGVALTAIGYRIHLIMEIYLYL